MERVNSYNPGARTGQTVRKEKNLYLMYDDLLKIII